MTTKLPVIIPIKFCTNTSFTFPTQSQRSRSLPVKTAKFVFYIMLSVCDLYHFVFLSDKHTALELWYKQALLEDNGARLKGASL